MLDANSLRGRLGLGYAAALVVALAIFAIVALLVVDRAQRSALDARLQATVGALRVVGDLSGTRLIVDAKDREEFSTIVGAAHSALVAPDGRIIVATDARGARAVATAFRARRDASYADVEVGGERVRAYTTQVRNGATVVAGAIAWSDAKAILALDRSVALAFVVAIPIIAFFAIFAGDAIARRGLAPLGAIATVAAAIEGHDLSQRLNLPARSDELGTLATTFDRMLDRLQRAFERERRFTNDASHELRTPLSVIRAEADLALRSERSVADYRASLATIAAEADALEALTRDLLAAARGGANVEDVRAPVDLAHVADSLVDRVSTIAGSCTMRVRNETRDAVVDANPALIERAVLAVLHNAMKYASDAGEVEIRVRDAGARVELTVSDDGPGFSGTALERGFERFWRDDDARALEGSGLGLSLARTIVERYGGTIALANARPHGAVVCMSFPAAN